MPRSFIVRIVFNGILGGVLLLGSAGRAVAQYDDYDEEYVDPERCAVASVAGLEVEPAQRGSNATASLKVESTSASSGSAKLFLIMQDSPKSANWEGVFVTRFGIDVELGKGAQPRRATKATIVVDGKKVPKLEVRHDGHFTGTGYASTLRVQTENDLHAEKAAKVLARGPRAVLTLFDKSDAEIARYELDVAGVAKIPAALSAAKWQCP